MGRKGVSKHKPNRSINNLLSKDSSNTRKGADTQLVKQPGTDQEINRKHSSDPRKKPKKR